MRPGLVVAGAIQILLAGGLVASHAVTTAPYVYPHYVLLILLHPFLLGLVGIPVPPWQRVYVAVALFLHPIGGHHGLYATVWWFDHLTHMLSATLVASIGYILIRSIRSDRRPGWIAPAFTMGFVLIAGFCWEVIEIYTPILTVYGPNDTAWDHAFNALGGILVVVFGRALLADAVDGFAAFLAERGIARVA